MSGKQPLPQRQQNEGDDRGLQETAEGAPPYPHRRDSTQNIKGEQLRYGEDSRNVRIAVLQAQLQTQSLGKGNFSVGKDETASVPPVNTDSNISKNPLAQSTQPDNFLMASGGKCCRNAQPVSLLQPTETSTGSPQ